MYFHSVIQQRKVKGESESTPAPASLEFELGPLRRLSLDTQGRALSAARTNYSYSLDGLTVLGGIRLLGSLFDDASTSGTVRRLDLFWQYLFRVLSIEY